jgi:hypothetical protein
MLTADFDIAPQKNKNKTYAMRLRWGTKIYGSEHHDLLLYVGRPL